MSLDGPRWDVENFSNLLDALIRAVKKSQRDSLRFGKISHQTLELTPKAEVSGCRRGKIAHIVRICLGLQLASPTAIERSLLIQRTAKCDPIEPRRKARVPAKER